MSKSVLFFWFLQSIVAELVTDLLKVKNPGNGNERDETTGCVPNSILYIQINVYHQPQNHTDYDEI